MHNTYWRGSLLHVSLSVWIALWWWCRSVFIFVWWPSSFRLLNNILIHSMFQMFIVFQGGHETFQFKVVSFRPNIPLRVLTKLTKIVTFKLTGQRIKLMFSSTVMTGSGLPVLERRWPRVMKDTISTTHSIGFSVNFLIYQLLPLQLIVWLSILWDTVSMTVLLSEDNKNKISRKLFCASVSLTMFRRQWDSLSGSLNYVMVVHPLRKFPPPSPMQPWKKNCSQQ